MPVEENRRALQRYLDAEYDYECWIKDHESTGSHKASGGVLFSVVLVEDNESAEQRKRALNSIQEQGYRKYELIEWEKRSQTWNDIAQSLHGAYTLFVDAKDWISPNALFEFWEVIKTHPDACWIYSDEDVYSEERKKRISPYFKPEWSRELFLCNLYAKDLSAYKTDLCKLVKVWDEGFCLRFLTAMKGKKTENNIIHLNSILYHKSDDRLEEEEINNLREVLAAKKEFIQENHLRAILEMEERTGNHRLIYSPIGKVSIIIPSKNNVKMLMSCIESIKNNTDYSDYEIVVVDNGSDSENKMQLQEFMNRNGITYLYEPMDFNFSKMCNMGAKASEGEYLLFLNDDVECVDSKWLARMLGQVNQAGVGAVGAKLLYPKENRIQHAGVEVQKNGPSHVLAGEIDEGVLEHGKNCLDYNYDAVTAACMLINKNIFEQIGGFDESFPISYNDVDLCYSLRERGLRNVVRTDAVLLHYESVSRGLDAEQIQKMNRLLQERQRLYHKHPWVEIPKREERVCKRVFKKKNSEGVFTAVIDGIYQEEEIQIRGWYWAIDTEYTNLSDAFLVFVDERKKREYWYTTQKEIREDVVAAIDNPSYLCGFVADLPLKKKKSLLGCKISICIYREGDRKGMRMDTGAVFA